MTTSRAAVFEGAAGRMELRAVPMPVPSGKELLVRVLGCTVCGSDLHTFEGRRSVPVPTVLGHEAVGEIAALGDAWSEAPVDLAGNPLRLGDRVTWAIVASCGTCALCRRGIPQKCERGVKYGHEAFRPGRELLGGFAEHCLLVPGTAIVRLPDDLPLAAACPASCATATVAAALEAAGELRDRRVCLFGAGMLGLTACAMSRAYGAAEVVCVDPAPLRRERALAFGASRAVSPEELTGTRDGDPALSGFDVVIELSGNPAAFEAAWPRIGIGGTLVLVGSVFPAAPVALSLEQVVRRQLTIRGVHNYAPRHLLSAVEFLTEHHARVPLADLVTDWFPLEAIGEAFERGRDAGAVRVGILGSSS